MSPGPVSAHCQLKAELWLPQGEDLLPGLADGPTLSPFISTVPSGTVLGKSGSSEGCYSLPESNSPNLNGILFATYDSYLGNLTFPWSGDRAALEHSGR